jgi:hypothetical protein
MLFKLGLCIMATGPGIVRLAVVSVEEILVLPTIVMLCLQRCGSIG